MGFWDWLRGEQEPKHWSQNQTGQGIDVAGENVIPGDAPLMDKLNYLSGRGMIATTEPDGGFRSLYSKGNIHDQDALNAVLEQQALSSRTKPASKSSGKMPRHPRDTSRGYVPDVSKMEMRDPLPDIPDAPVGGDAFYRIKRGDELGKLTGGDYALAKKIAEYNNLADWNMINEGASLRLKDEWLSPSSRLLNNTLAGIRYPG